MAALATLRSDLRAAVERDPAARSTVEVALLYPGVHALWSHRLAHRLWRDGRRFLARLVSAWSHRMTGIDIHPAASLGPRLFIDHGTGVVIGETAQVGADVTLYHGVTLGGVSTVKGTKRHPTVGDRVTIGAGAKVLGPVTVGSGSRIGANAVVVKSVPPDSVVVGVPGQVVRRSGDDRPRGADLAHDQLPDLVGACLQSILVRVDRLEVTAGGAPSPAGVRPGPTGEWAAEDFSI